MSGYYEQIVVLRVRVEEDEPGGAPSTWNWSEALDMARPDGAEVIASGEVTGPNKEDT